MIEEKFEFEARLGSPAFVSFAEPFDSDEDDVSLAQDDPELSSVLQIDPLLAETPDLSKTASNADDELKQQIVQLLETVLPPPRSKSFGYDTTDDFVDSANIIILDEDDVEIDLFRAVHTQDRQQFSALLERRDQVRHEQKRRREWDSRIDLHDLLEGYLSQHSSSVCAQFVNDCQCRLKSATELTATSLTVPPDVLQLWLEIDQLLVERCKSPAAVISAASPTDSPDTARISQDHLSNALLRRCLPVLLDLCLCKLLLSDGATEAPWTVQQIKQQCSRHQNRSRAAERQKSLQWKSSLQRRSLCHRALERLDLQQQQSARALTLLTQHLHVLAVQCVVESSRYVQLLHLIPKLVTRLHPTCDPSPLTAVCHDEGGAVYRRLLQLLRSDPTLSIPCTLSQMSDAHVALMIVSFFVVKIFSLPVSHLFWWG